MLLLGFTEKGAGTKIYHLRIQIYLWNSGNENVDRHCTVPTLSCKSGSLVWNRIAAVHSHMAFSKRKN